MFIQNLIRYRRMVIILIGLIIINIITRFIIDNFSHDNFALIVYLLMSIIWIDLIRVFTEPNVKMVDQWIKEDNGY
jgi:cell division protein FtsW (lipid II flippase)